MGLLILIMISAIFGNAVLLTSIWRTPVLRTRTNWFIFNLACADLAVALICMPFSLVTCYLQRWVFGHVLCQVNGFLNILFGATSLLTLSAISLEKYFSIVRAMDHVITKRRAASMILVTWAVPAVFAVMPLTGFTSFRHNPGKELEYFNTADNVWHRYVARRPLPLVEGGAFIHSALRMSRHVAREGGGGGEGGEGGGFKRVKYCGWKNVCFHLFHSLVLVY